jgi:hypothetical protein
VSPLPFASCKSALAKIEDVDVSAFGKVVSRAIQSCRQWCIAILVDFVDEIGCLSDNTVQSLAVGVAQASFEKVEWLL